MGTLLSSSISLLLSMHYAKKYSPIYYEKKHIYIIFAFIFLSSVYSILVSNKFLEINIIFDQFISITLILFLIIYGYLNNIYNYSTLKNIFLILKINKNVKKNN